MPCGTRKCNNSDCKRTCGTRNGIYDDICSVCWKLSPQYDNWCRVNGKGKYSTTYTSSRLPTVSSKIITDTINLDFDMLSSDTSFSEDESQDMDEMLNLYNSLSTTSLKLKADLKCLKKLIKKNNI